VCVLILCIFQFHVRFHALCCSVIFFCVSVPHWLTGCKTPNYLPACLLTHSFSVFFSSVCVFILCGIFQFHMCIQFHCFRSRHSFSSMCVFSFSAFFEFLVCFHCRYCQFQFRCVRFHSVYFSVPFRSILCVFSFSVFFMSVVLLLLIIIIGIRIRIIEICKAPTLRLKALNKHTHIMYIEMNFFYQK